MATSGNRRSLFWGVLGGVVLLDFVTKQLAVALLGRVPVYLLGEWLSFRLVYNPGAAFGIHVGAYSRVVFTLLALVALVVLGAMVRQTRAADWPRREEHRAMSIVREFERAFNRQDVPALVACFTPDGSYHDTFFGGHAGADQLRAMFERMFREGRDYAWAMETVVETAERAAAEWSFGYVVTEAIPRSAGRPVRFRGMSLFEKRDGKIATYREYFDTGAALLQLGFKPESVAKVLARSL